MKATNKIYFNSSVQANKVARDRTDKQGVPHDVRKMPNGTYIVKKRGSGVPLSERKQNLKSKLAKRCGISHSKKVV